MLENKRIETSLGEWEAGNHKNTIPMKAREHRQEGMTFEQKGKNVILTTTLSLEDYHDLKLAHYYVAMDTVSGKTTKRGRDGLVTIMEYLRPAIEAERDNSIQI